MTTSTLRPATTRRGPRPRQSRRSALHLLPVAVVAPAMFAATQIGDPGTGRLASVGILCLAGWVLAVVADDLFGHDAQIDRPGAPRLTTGRHLVLDTRLRTRHVLATAAALAGVVVLLVLRLDDGASWWFRRLHTLTAVLALAPCAPYLRLRRRGLSELSSTFALTLCVPALVLGALVATAPAAWLIRLSPVGVVAGGTMLVHTAVSADWDRSRGWASLPARIGEPASRLAGALVVAAGSVAAVALAQIAAGWSVAIISSSIAALTLAVAVVRNRQRPSAVTLAASCSLVVAALTIAASTGS
jgi:1,4-dihydroxy-2-naphthoate octaprenyltransferase